MFERDPPVEAAADVQVGGQVGGDVFVRGCQQEADPAAAGEPADVECHDLRQRAVERRSELVGDDPRVGVACSHADRRVSMSYGARPYMATRLSP